MSRILSGYSNHRRRKAIAALDGFDDILIGPIPVGPFAKGNHFPAEYSEAPHIGRRCEFSIVDRFDGRPTYGNFSASRRVTIIGIDLSTQTEIGHLTDQILVHENVSCRQILYNRSSILFHTHRSDILDVRISYRLNISFPMQCHTAFALIATRPDICFLRCSEMIHIRLERVLILADIRTRRYASNEPLSMYSVTIMIG